MDTPQTAPSLPKNVRQQIVDRMSKQVKEKIMQGPSYDTQYDKPNWEVTRKIQKEEKYVKFQAWCDKFGVKAPSLEYPVAYGPKGELIGVRARRDIGLGESYLYVPVNMTINEDQYKRSWIGEIYTDNDEEFKDRDNYEHYAMNFFVAYQMSLGAKSFWSPYFEIASEANLPLNWPENELNFLEDEVLKMSAQDLAESVEEEYAEAYAIAIKYKHLINPEKFTLENYKRAMSLVMTRVFGWNVPYMMLVPFADNLNHHCVENYFELFNYRLTKRWLKNERNFNNHEKCYFTKKKHDINFLKHFEEDKDQDWSDPGQVSYHSHKYYKKLKMRDECLAISTEQMMNDPKYADKQVWDLKYISTSDEEDPDKTSSEEESDESGEEEQDENVFTQIETKKGDQEKRKVLFHKNPEEQGSQVPEIARKLKNQVSGRERIRYQYTYKTENGEVTGEKPKKSIVIKAKMERHTPNDLIELLTREKKSMWEKEQKHLLLKEKEEEAITKAFSEFNNSSDDDEEENFAWYDINDKDTYFVLNTQNKLVYKADDQVFICYGRRTNQYLLGNYGFSLSKNKWNSLNFKVHLDFDWKKKVDAKSEKQKTEEEDEDNEAVVSKMIKLKEHRLRDEVFAYIRANIMNQQEKDQATKTEEQKKNDESKSQHLLVSSPVDPEFELLVIACSINLLEGLKKSKFKQTMEKDVEFLKLETLNPKKRQAIIHRLGQKTILQNNINLMQILMRICIRFKGGTSSDIKSQYMQQVDEHEKPEEVMENRLKIRKYLREIVRNQKRILQAATELAVQQKFPMDSQMQKVREQINLQAGDIEKETEFSAFMLALDNNLRKSDTPYFEDKNCPSKSVDLQLYREIQKRELTTLITPEKYPALFGWHCLISQYSEEAKNSWVN